MIQGRSRKITIIVLSVLTFLLIGLAVFIAIRLQTPPDTSVDDCSSPGASCDGHGCRLDKGEKWCNSSSSCISGDLPAYCADPPPGSTPASSGGSNKCDSSSSTATYCRNQAPGTVVPYAGGTCVCTFTQGSICGCVRTSGSTCNSGDCFVVGAACTPSGGGNGICMSATSDSCVCQKQNVSAASQPASGCTATSCNAGYFCDTDKTCKNKYGNTHSCNLNVQCLSGLCVNGFCSGGTSNGCTSDSQCTSGKYCNLGVCANKKANNTGCFGNNECTSGICASNVCRAPSSGGSCVEGQITCEAGGTGFGQMCSGGTLQARDKYDACAPAPSGADCSQMGSFSGGEPSKGRFVGCNGTLNCFCPDPQSAGVGVQPTCYSDPGNDSCGANAAQPVPTSTPASTPASSGGGTSTPPNTSLATSTPVSYSCIGMTRSPAGNPVAPGQLLTVVVRETSATRSTSSCVYLTNPDGSQLAQSGTPTNITDGPNSTHTNTYTVTVPVSATEGNNYGIVYSQTCNFASQAGGACVQSLNLDTDAPQQPSISVIKSGSTVCQTEGGATIDYTVTVTNSGSVAGTVNSVVDQLPSQVTSSSQVSNTVPTASSITADTITWTGPFTVNANASITFTYRVTFAQADLNTFTTNQLTNTVTVTYGTENSTATFTLLTVMSCLPATGLFDEPAGLILVGLVLILAGILVNRSGLLLNLFGANVRSSDATSKLMESLLNTGEVQGDRFSRGVMQEQEKKYAKRKRK